MLTALHVGEGAFQDFLATPALKRQRGGEPDHGDGEHACCHLLPMWPAERTAHESNDGKDGRGIGQVEGVLGVLRPERQQHRRYVERGDGEIRALAEVEGRDH